MTVFADKVTARSLVAMKGRERIVALTAYDYPTARILDASGVDLLLVGDSLGMVILGQPNTLGVTVGMVAHHTRAVARGRSRALLVADMPFLSYHAGRNRAVLNAGKLVRAGAEAVKLEGGRKRLPIVEAVLDAEIPVMGHIGLTPQSFHKLGGYRPQGRGIEGARELLDDARALDAAGVFAIVLEAIPEEVAREITASVRAPTIGIGAGVHCDGQILVLHDILGMVEEVRPKFVRRYAELGQELGAAVTRFGADVRQGSFPGAEESYHLPKEVLRSLGSG